MSEQSGLEVRRSRHAQQYVVIPNRLARDANISLTARGLLVYLLSLPPGSRVTTDGVAEIVPESQLRVRRAMQELRQAGYVELITERDSKGQFRKHLEVCDINPAVGNPTAGNTTANRSTEEKYEDPPLPPTGEESDEEPLDALFTADFEQGFVETVAPSKPRDDDPGFLAFWSVYPRHIAKQPARRAWRTAIRGGAVPGEIIAGAEHYRDDRKRKSKGIEFTAHPATWLNGQRWLDWAEEENAAKYRYSNNPFEN